MSKNNKEIINLHKGHRERLRKELLACNFQVENPHKLLEFMLFHCNAQKDTNDLAHKLINKFGSFNGVLEASMKDLQKVEGVGEVTAYFLKSFLPIMQYYNNHKVESNKAKTFINPFEFASHYFEKLKYETKEILMVVGFDENYKVKELIRHTNNKVNFVEFDFNEIFSALCESNYNKFALIHNHPTGNTNPSAQDERTTKDIFIKAKLVEKDLVEHLIVGRDSYFSYALSDRFSQWKSLLDKTISDIKS